MKVPVESPGFMIDAVGFTLLYTYLIPTTTLGECHEQLVNCTILYSMHKLLKSCI